VTPNHPDVLIIGGGPVGLGLACELGWRGVRCTVVDETRHDYNLPDSRINLANTRTLEFFRRWGFEREVRGCQFPSDFPMSIAFVTSLRGKLIGKLDYPSMGAAGEHSASPTNRQRIPQPWLDPIMRRAAAGFDSVDLRWHTRFVSLEQDADGVTATIERLEDASKETLRARYLAACDGARSSVREQLGIKLLGDQFIGMTHSIYFKSSEMWKLHDKGKAAMMMFLDEKGLWGVLNVVDGSATWRLSIVGGKEFVPADQVDAPTVLRRMMGGDFTFEIIGVYPWVRRAVVAEHFVNGRCFLVGDSAHQLTPTGGFGMNTGLGESVDLGWKLDAVLRGWGGDTLLTSYEAERQPIAQRNVREATANAKRLMSLPTFPWIDQPGLLAGFKRKILGRRFAESTRAEWESDGVVLGYRYDPSPICIPDGKPPMPDNPARYVPSARPGSRAPHAWIAPGKSTLDLFGQGFVLLDFAAANADVAALEEAAQTVGLPLRREAIANADIARLYECKLVLVRPDGHVAWRCDELDHDPAQIVDVIRGAGGLK
jgi:2-polyprenyl-6-methoxyphenol hydroxylase-like FAD-dependent oxidoreductase